MQITPSDRKTHSKVQHYDVTLNKENCTVNEFIQELMGDDDVHWGSIMFLRGGGVCDCLTYRDKEISQAVDSRIVDATVVNVTARSAVSLPPFSDKRLDFTVDIEFED